MKRRGIGFASDPPPSLGYISVTRCTYVLTLLKSNWKLFPSEDIMQAKPKEQFLPITSLSFCYYCFKYFLSKLPCHFWYMHLRSTSGSRSRRHLLKDLENIQRLKIAMSKAQIIDLILSPVFHYLKGKCRKRT